MRPRGVSPPHSRLIMAMRSLTVVALSLLLIVSSLPIVTIAVFAAPPDPSATLETSESAAEKETPDSDKTERGSLNRLPDELIDKEEREDPTSGKRSIRGWAGFESIRRRGLEAPFDLRQPEPEAVDEPPDKGDGEPRQERSTSESNANSKKDADNKKSSRSRDQDLRVWPMRADSYTFTQAFGCVPQIANFYFPGENCPPSAPVVHSGIDLAAPEGTPFYAAASGWVTGSGYDREVGVPNTRIIIQHDGRNDGFASEYLHWVASFVEVGDYVEAGEQIGEVGNVGYSTGPHLHFSVVDLDTGEHVDPVRWLPDEPGSQGYRGIRPNTRARMRLPAGTTAGLPEEADPAPPPPPEREDVPESPPPSAEGERGDKGKDRSGGKRKRHRDERRAEKRNGAEENQADGANEESADAPEADTEDTVKEGKNQERTRKRDRDKDGKQSENAEKGEDGGSKRKSDDKGKDKSGNKDNRGGRHGNGNGSGNDRNHGNSDNGKDKQHKGKDRDRNDRNKSEDNSGADGTDGSGGDDGGDGTNPDGDGTNGDDGAGDDTPKDDGGETDGDASDDDQPDANTTDDGGTGNDNVAGGDETSATQPADDTAAQPVKKAKRRKSS